jgi:glycosyltransferase 2 family protein
VFGVLVTTLELPLGVPGWAPAALGAGLLAAAGAAWALGRGTATGRRARELVVALLRPSRRLWSGRGAALLVMSAVLWVVEGAVYAILGSVAGVHLSLLDGLYVMALANIAALVPAAPGYVGTFDAAVLLGVGLVTAAAEPAALAYVVLVRFVLFVPITLVGLAALVARFGGRRQLAGMRAAPRPAPHVVSTWGTRYRGCAAGSAAWSA